MNKPRRSIARPLGEVARSYLAETFARQGFASTEIIARWAEIAGPEIAAHSEPMKINWPRQSDDGADQPEPATLMLRVEGPAAIEIQHLSAVILERVNRFFGWPAIGRIALRQAPLMRRRAPTAPPPPDAEAVQAETKRLSGIADEDLRDALARLGAAVKRG